MRTIRPLLRIGHPAQERSGLVRPLNACAALYIYVPRGGAGGKVVCNKRAHTRGHDCPVVFEVGKTRFSKAGKNYGKGALGYIRSTAPYG